jgi:hypothetical protein
LALAGPYAASVLALRPPPGGTLISIVDLRDEVSGLSRRADTSSTFFNAEVPALRLAPNGAAAWVACRRFTPKNVGKCVRGGKQVKVVVAFGLDFPYPRVVGRGTRIDPRSLALRGNRVVWKDGARRRSAALY